MNTGANTRARPFGSFRILSLWLVAALGAGVFLAACKGEDKPPLTPDDEKMFDIDASISAAPTATVAATATATAPATASAPPAASASAKPAAKK